MFFYQTKDRLSFEEINTKTIQLLKVYCSKHSQYKKNQIQQQKE
jgi:ribonuclease P protein component